MRVRRPTRLSTALLACATAVFLAGCGATTTADPPASPPPASPTATAPTPPSLPPGASKHTKAGAIAFVRHYISLINYAQATGRTQPLARVAAHSCSSCRGIEASIDAIYRNGGTFRGGLTKVVRVLDASAYPDIDGYTVNIAVRIGASTVHRPGTEDRRAKGGTNVLSIIVRPLAHTWKVDQWSRAK